MAAGPLIGGLFTTYASWRWVFVGEVLIVLAILAVGRRIADAPPDTRPRLDLVGTALSALGLGLVVFGILKAGSWGFVDPKPAAPTWLGLSPAIWLVIGGGVVLWIFFTWESRVLKRGGEPLVDPSILLNRTLRGGLTAFFFQYLLQARYDAPGSVSNAPTTNVTRAEPLPSARCQRGGPFSGFLYPRAARRSALARWRSVASPTAPTSAIQPSAIVAAGLIVFLVVATVSDPSSAETISKPRVMLVSNAPRR